MMMRTLAIATVVSLGGTALTAQLTPRRLMAGVDVLKGAEEAQLRWPVAVAVASEVEVAIADAFDLRLLVFRRVGVSWSLAVVETLPATPAAMVWDGRRYVLALRGSQHLLTISSPELERRRIELPAGVVASHLAALPGGGLLLHDAAASRLLRIDVAGASEVGVVEGSVTGLAVDASGSFLVAIGDESRVLRFAPSGRPRATWDLPASGPVPAWPTGLASEPGGRVFVADRHGSRILVLDGEGQWIGVGGRPGWDPGLLRWPTDLALLPGSRMLVVVDQGNGRGQLFRISSDGFGS